MSNVEMLEIGTDGKKYDKKGNPVPEARKNQRDMSNDILLYTADKEILTYASVYPGPQNVHQNKNLSDLAYSYELSGAFIGPKVCSVYTSDKRSDQYFIVSKDDVTRNYSLEINRAPGGPATVIGQGFSTDNYLVTNYAARSFLPDDTVNNADEALMLTTRNTKFVEDVILFAWDQRVANSYFTTAATIANSLPTATMTSAGGGKITAATPLLRYVAQSLNYAKAQIIAANNGRAPNTVVMSSTTALAIAACPEVAGQVVYGLGASFTKDGGYPGATSAALYGLPDFLQGLRVVVSNLPVNSAAVNATPSFAPLIDDTMTVMIVDEPSRQSQSAITAFRQNGINVRSYRDFSLNGMYTEVELIQTEKLTNPTGLFVITDCL